jgi:hypothetical protein
MKKRITRKKSPTSKKTKQAVRKIKKVISKVLNPKPKTRKKTPAPMKSRSRRISSVSPDSGSSSRERPPFYFEPQPVSPYTQTKSVNGYHEFPHSYGRNFIHLMVRDPYFLYTYWEILQDVEKKALAELGGDWSHVKSVLRVYDTTDKSKAPSFFDIPLQNMATCWYVEAQPNHSYFIEIGLLHSSGRFIVLARSNEVTTPRDGMSDVIDEEWMGIDFDRMYALSGGFGVGKSSLELKELMKKRLIQAVSSGSGGASPVRRAQGRKFWFELNCELIVYGATEPDASVTVQGKPVELRPDGTFTLRFALPDGQQTIDASAVSSDGLEERIITPIVRRKTQRPAPILKEKIEKVKSGK